MSTLPEIKLTGGPAGHRMKMEVDGVEVKGVLRVELVADVNDVVGVQTFQFVSMDILVEGFVPKKPAYLASIRRPNLERAEDDDLQIGSWVTLGEGRGATIKEAMLAAIDAVTEDIE